MDDTLTFDPVEPDESADEAQTLVEIAEAVLDSLTWADCQRLFPA